MVVFCAKHGKQNLGISDVRDPQNVERYLSKNIIEMQEPSEENFAYFKIFTATPNAAMMSLTNGN